MRWGPAALLLAAALGCQYMPHAYEPHSAQIPDAQTVPLPGATLTFASEGSGPSILFVHGNIADLRIWVGQRGTALKGFWKVAYSRRYHYPNAWAGDGSDYTEANNVKDLEGILRELHLGRAHLVGHGSGAQLAVEVALSHPELVRTLVLVEPEMTAAAASRPGFDSLAEERADLYGRLRTLEIMGEAAKAAQQLFNWSNANPNAYEELPPPLQGEILDNATVFPFFLNAPPPAVPCTTLARVAAPTLVVTGERTNPYFSQLADAIAACIPGAAREFVPGGAHVVQRDVPDAFNAVLVGFLSTHNN